VRQIAQIIRSQYPLFVDALVHWSNTFEVASVLNSNDYADHYGKYSLLAGIGSKRIIRDGGIREVRAFYKANKTWLFGHLAYDLKNQLENLQSKHAGNFDFGDLSFFEPKILVVQNRGEEMVRFFADDEAEINSFIESLSHFEGTTPTLPKLKAKMQRQAYFEAIARLKKEIQYGNIYEINYCQEFYKEEVQLDSAAVYSLLNSASAMPFSAFYKLEHNSLMCASPERFLVKRGNQIYSQPIKGTIKRGATKQEDEQLKQKLQADLKEQTENVMIVDLVRNDLSRTAARGSVKVEELFGVYPFPQVHQLISTVYSTLDKLYDIFDVLETCFPMGSMTGAPKISAMQLAEEHETSKRELYSGSVGYITPEGDADFNVVIRSLMYSEKREYLSLMVGGAITNLANAEQEYEECLLKAKAIFELGEK
jgi:para-aminobenzoate synthetase component 1